MYVLVTSIYLLWIAELFRQSIADYIDGHICVGDRKGLFFTILQLTKLFTRSISNGKFAGFGIDVYMNLSKAAR